jgi:hypothetical protein
MGDEIEGRGIGRGRAEDGPREGRLTDVSHCVQGSGVVTGVIEGGSASVKVNSKRTYDSVDRNIFSPGNLERLNRDQFSRKYRITSHDTSFPSEDPAVRLHRKDIEADLVLFLVGLVYQLERK